jgi:acetyl esterase/lipase
MTDLSRPPFDPELGAALAVIYETGVSPNIEPEMILPMREARAKLSDPGALSLEEAGITSYDVSIPGHLGDEITISVLRRTDSLGGGACLFYTHGGGMIFGDRWTGMDRVIPWIVKFDVVVVTVEYRLAPEFPDPTPIEDAYAGLRYAAEHAAEFGFDPNRLVVAGASAGGGIAAGLALLARDRGGPQLYAQLLICPMLDDRNKTVSSHQVDGVGIWARTSNDTGWNALLGERRGTESVSIYAAPARASDLSGLPPAFIDVGSVEVFRDEAVTYASRIWEAGGNAELHVWPGGFHGFDSLAPHAAVSQAAIAARDAWLDRTLSA